MKDGLEVIVHVFVGSIWVTWFLVLLKRWGFGPGAGIGGILFGSFCGLGGFEWLRLACFCELCSWI